jgi:hypothetical protein
MHTRGFEMLPNNWPGTTSFGGGIIDDYEEAGLGSHE